MDILGGALLVSGLLLTGAWGIAGWRGGGGVVCDLLTANSSEWHNNGVNVYTSWYGLQRINAGKKETIIKRILNY